MFSKNEKLVYPGHGIGTVSTIETKEVFGRKTDFLVITIHTNGMKILVPANEAKDRGLRKLCTPKQAAEALRIAQGPGKPDLQLWNRRYRALMEMIKTGEILELAQAYADLRTTQDNKDLSFGERKMLDVVKDLLFTEIELVLESKINFIAKAR